MLFSGIANLIPYVGPIGLIPMVIANVFTDPHRMLIVVAYMLIIQQIDGNVLIHVSLRGYESASDYDFGALYCQVISTVS